MQRVILYAEDDLNEAFLFDRAFRGVAPAAGVVLRVVSDGRQAIEYLARQKQFADRKAHPPADLVVLDLRLPKCSGFEVLEWIRRQPALRTLPVVLFSSSQDERDQRRAEAMGASEYRIKPLGLDEYRAAVKQILEDWLAPTATAGV